MIFNDLQITRSGGGIAAAAKLSGNLTSARSSPLQGRQAEAVSAFPKGR